MTRPRFLFVTSFDGERPGGSGAPGAGKRPVQSGPVESVTWRLCGPNNRVLGRCSAPYGSLQLSQASVRLLQQGIGRAQPFIEMANPVKEWTWRLTLDGVEVARAVRTYQRHRQCQYGLSVFLASVSEAEVGNATPQRRLRGLQLPDVDTGRSALPGDSAPNGLRLRAGDCAL